ncbi:DUF4124 domain-containing protein [Marinagarivorans cellulosilyticus]|uniref:DUF4124 domain-containing protein n=1 Tax=Marinagarivorans cellulosilyticus TaxID=2721545 RepID=A0AAN1WI74_9GAMM|nr:DUF4124 domain-containing protein [Marinagarivorans cellulosilyticus]BCD98000.1 hypothetical protein MARGE09_P2201 [Marinagarivorans cellulosilyticus]
MKIADTLRANRCLLLTCCFMVSTPAMAGEYYKWVDDKGVVHFSERPPQETNTAEKIKTHARTPTEEETSAADTAIEKELAPTQQIMADPARCDQEKARLKQLSSGSRIRMKDAQGGFYYLDENQIQQEIQKSKQAISESCQ